MIELVQRLKVIRLETGSILVVWSGLIEHHRSMSLSVLGSHAVQLR